MKINSKLKVNTLYQHCICEVPTKYKTKIAKLLTEIMKQYNVKGENREMEEAFKSIFKSNLNWIIDEIIVETKSKEESQKESKR